MTGHSPSLTPKFNDNMSIALFRLNFLVSSFILHFVDHTLWIVLNRLHFAYCTLRFADCTLRIALWRLHFTDCTFQFVIFRFVFYMLFSRLHFVDYTRWTIVSTIDHYRAKFLLSLSIVLTFEKTIVIDSRKTCKKHV